MANESLHNLTPIEAANIDYGQNGATFFNDTVSRNGEWRAIYHLAATVYTTLTSGLTVDGSTFPSTVSFPAGTWLYGHFTTIRLASGTAIAYKG
jgi:hypothetical protein